MNFGKTVFASLLGSTISLLIVVPLVIFIVVSMAVAAIGGLVSGFEDGKNMTKIESNSILHLQLDQPIVERTNDSDFNINFNTLEPENSIGLTELLGSIEQAASDEDIEGVFLDLNGVMAMPSTMQDIRASLEEFRSSGKWIIAYAEGYTQNAYYLASVADEVYLYPEGDMQFYGLFTELAFFKKMLDDIGVDVQVVRGPDNKYKSAVEGFTREQMSDESREQISAYLTDIWGQMTAEIAASRSVDVAKLNTIADSLMVRKAQNAVDLKLIDGLKYGDEINDLLLERSGLAAEAADANTDDETEDSAEEEDPLDFLDDDNESPRLVSLGDYARTLGKRGKDKDEDKEDDVDPWDKDQVAVVYAVGAIESGKGDDATIGSERLVKALRKARLDDDVKAVVMRVNSPGGSALASDVIWRETELIKEAGKPFVVSFGDVAASGGYYISAAADKIYANENTITGSIGVFGLIPNMQELFEENIGITFDRVSTNNHAGILSATRPLDETEREWLDVMITEVYDEFLERVAEGRGMSVAEVDSIAQGRVWSGTDAREIGLIDEFGDLQDAIEAAAAMAEIENYEIKELPKMLDPLEELMKEFGAQATVENYITEAGLDHRHAAYLLQLHAMLESREVVQARLPYSIVVE